MEISKYLVSQPEVIWLVVVMGAVAVIGIVDFLKCWVKKKVIKWVVFFVSLGVSIVLSPLVPPLVSTIIILWLLILSVATIARNSIVDGLPNLVNKLIGGSNKEGGK